MKEKKINSIGIKINQINFESENSCTIWGQVFVENGYYHCDIQLTVHQLYIILKHHDHIGRLIQIMIRQDYISQVNEYPNFIDIEAKLGNGVILQADEFEMSAVKARRKNPDGSTHYAMQIAEIHKLNRLQMLKNTTQIVRLTSMPNDRIVPDISVLKEAYSKYRYYHSLNIQDGIAKSKSGLDNPYLFKMAEYYHSA